MAPGSHANLIHQNIRFFHQTAAATIWTRQVDCIANLNSPKSRFPPQCAGLGVVPIFALVCLVATLDFGERKLAWHEVTGLGLPASSGVPRVSLHGSALVSVGSVCRAGPGSVVVSTWDSLPQARIYE